MVGISHSVSRQRGRGSHLVYYRSYDWSPLAAASSGKIEAPARLGTSGGTRGLEAHSPKSIASALSHELDELFVRSDQSSFPHMHDLDRDWPGTGTFSVRLSRDVGPTRVASGARTNAPADLRILGLGRRAAPVSRHPTVDGPRCVASFRKAASAISQPSTIYVIQLLSRPITIVCLVSTVAAGVIWAPMAPLFNYARRWRTSLIGDAFRASNTIAATVSILLIDARRR